jgi:hypothetical protein
MGILRNFIERYKERRAKQKALSEDVSIQRSIVEKQKSADMRELERYYKEQEEEKIKQQLSLLRKRKMDSMWQGNMFSGNKNLFNDSSITKGDVSLRGNVKWL